jgi:hypothetical protein
MHMCSNIPSIITPSIACNKANIGIKSILVDTETNRVEIHQTNGIFYYDLVSLNKSKLVVSNIFGERTIQIFLK